MDKEFDNNTQKGTALEVLANLLFNCCKGIKSTPKIRTSTNQIDCAVRNDFKLQSTVYEEFNSFIYGECKNEKSVPGNDYFYKILGNINKSKSRDERGFGILFSRKKVAKTWKELSREAFIMHNVLIINFSDKDFKLIKEGENFLTLVQEKIQYVKGNLTTAPEKHKLYRKS